ncbi:hypothetical protein P170DRAFT_424798 [Aspergillus steynii IBT 23096]|uniref:Uncharacterized protein n=1 Tax=Aspergillus steynii IBT 23096 TaxID=1392250 RepID=A0A2I2GC11_9EURO|nr:uncharacterized protein P170DRAFT_424798 [Aspergillus steynii IBT 23096]PLB50420.1 hypothetical protein P170DRAFT_424798 [Aspergillus steynii IBT 23096]
MSQPRDLPDSRIVMAEQSSHDVVNQTLSGGDPSPSDVPASTNDKKPAGGDVGEINHTATTTQSESTTNPARVERMEGPESLAHKNEAGPGTERPSTDLSRQGPGPVASRALEMNGMASASDGGEDTASQGGSESDASRTDSKLNSRASSTKRTTSFKPVSFAKFAVPKAPGTPPAAKAPEKAPLSSGTPLGLPPQNLRPRLVAKSTGLRDSLSKGGPNAAKPGGGGPDPSQVWNRNQPVQQTPPKHLTDEELKQQYGIHMTSRIQEDGGGTESKWADIDDDEDDWAPETIEWTDGTKTNLTQPEPAPPTAQDNNTRVPAEPKEEPLPPQQISTAREAPRFMPKPTTSIGPNPTVLRLGANAERQAKNANILSRGPNEKSPLMSSSPAPPPAKSPWAPLPPVEKISPVMPPVQLQPPMRAPPREPPHQQDAGAGIAHPKEIAADDFNRSLRETQYGTRELYNSRSGRYEPVPDTRKGPWRAEQGMRPPSLLQRPLPGEPVGPAEPSPAFQTHRSGGQDGTHWTRRRTSSNVSGGSGSFGRRMSIGRPDAAQRSFDTRRGSQVNGMMEQPVFSRDPGPANQPLRETSPTRHGPGMPWSPRGQPAALHDKAPVTHGHSIQPPPEPQAGEQAVPPPEGSQGPQGPQEDPVLMQQRIMKEKRMEARQRRLEQEEKEEAAKRERIRQKLEALGPPPDKVKQPRRESLESNKAESHVPSNTAQASHSPPKPPVPEPTGEPKQYGMMKVHHPDTVKKLIEKERAAEKATPMATARRAPSPAREPKPDANIANGFQPSGEPQVQTPEKFPEAKLDEQNTQWRGGLNVSSPYSPWTSSTKLVGPPPITNPWKPLSNDKTLGNGIFDQGLGGFPARDISLRGHLGLDQSSVTPASQPFSAPSRSPQESASISPLPSPEVRHASYEPINPIARPGPIGPPSLQHTHWQHDNRVSGTAAWHNFHAVAAKREAEENEKLRSEMNTIREGPSSLPLTLNETWRQVRSGDQPGQRQIVGVSRSTDSNPPVPNPLPGLDHPVGPLPFVESPARPLGTVPVRSSRFFPQATEQHKKPAFEEGDDMRSPSPPPPEDMSNHPVYTGDTNRPLVHLPAPKPIVKLPPKVVAPPPPPPTFASMVAAPPRTAPVSTATSWQEKINCLFGKKTVSEKKNALAVTSASKEPLDVPLHIASVSVSLPQKDDLPTGDGEITARQVEEAEEMFEDREVGSLPVVRVPTMAPAAAWQAAPAPSQSRLRSKSLKPMQVHSIEPFSFGFYDKDTTGGFRVSIRLPGAVMAKTMLLPKKAGSHSSLRSRGSSSYKPRKTTKPREGTGSSNTKKSTQSQHTNGNSSPRHQSRNASWGPRTFSGSR